MGTIKNYVDRKEWESGESNVYAHEINEIILFTFLRGVDGWSKILQIMST